MQGAIAFFLLDEVDALPETNGKHRTEHFALPGGTAWSGCVFPGLSRESRLARGAEEYVSLYALYLSVTRIMAIARKGFALFRSVRLL